MDCGLLWCFYQTLILTAPIHCRASIAETHFYKPDEETNIFNNSFKYIFFKGVNIEYSILSTIPADMMLMLW